jgi:hypothetical protein
MRGRHLSEQALNTYHVILYGIPLDALVIWRLAYDQ